jgi:hypothetical protein
MSIKVLTNSQEYKIKIAESAKQSEIRSQARKEKQAKQRIHESKLINYTKTLITNNKILQDICALISCQSLTSEKDINKYIKYYILLPKNIKYIKNKSKTEITLIISDLLNQLSDHKDYDIIIMCKEYNK